MNKGITMAGWEVRAILDGRKTQTRRVVKLPRWAIPTTLEQDDTCTMSAQRKGTGCRPEIPCPFGQPGTRLFVKETWRVNKSYDKFASYVCYVAMGGDVAGCIDYKATPRKDAEGWGGRWRPSTQMPRWASRITLEVVSVRVERLGEITEGDAKAEGCDDYADPFWRPTPNDPDSGGYPSAQRSFEFLWDEDHKRGPTFESNPWVWVIEFRRIEAWPPSKP